MGLKWTDSLDIAIELDEHYPDTDPAQVAKARRHLLSRGLYGQVSVRTFDGDRLPYVDGLVNLIVADELGGVPMEEIVRVLAPRGGGAKCWVNCLRRRISTRSATSS